MTGIRWGASVLPCAREDTPDSSLSKGAIRGIPVLVSVPMPRRGAARESRPGAYGACTNASQGREKMQDK